MWANIFLSTYLLPVPSVLSCNLRTNVGCVLVYIPSLLGGAFILAAILLYTSGPVSLKERLLYALNKLFVKQVKSFLLLLDLDPFISLSSSHNIKYIKLTNP